MCVCVCLQRATALDAGPREVCISFNISEGSCKGWGGIAGGCVLSAIAVGGIAVVYVADAGMGHNLLIPYCWFLCVIGSCHLAYSFLFIILTASALSSFQL